MGKKIMDIKTRRDASRGRKSKAGGGKKNQKRLKNIHPWNENRAMFFFCWYLDFLCNFQISSRSWYINKTNTLLHFACFFFFSHKIRDLRSKLINAKHVGWQFRWKHKTKKRSNSRIGGIILGFSVIFHSSLTDGQILSQRCYSAFNKAGY